MLKVRYLAIGKGKYKVGTFLSLLQFRQVLEKPWVHDISHHVRRSQVYLQIVWKNSCVSGSLLGHSHIEISIFSPLQKGRPVLEPPSVHPT